MTIEEGGVLTVRHLNRALLARQHLLTRVEMPASEMIAHLVGMQSQAPNDPYIGLWTRLHHFQPEELSRLMVNRHVVRGSLMRGTIHLVISDDYLALRPVMQEMHERSFPQTAEGKLLPNESLPKILRDARDLLEMEPLTTGELGDRLAPLYPEIRSRGLAWAARSYLPLVQTTPRGVWGESQQATWALAEQWIGRPLETNIAPDRMLIRYLKAFGPATIADMQAWSGLKSLRQIIARLRPQLRVFRNEQGQELFDVTDGILPDADTPAPVRFLPGFENALLGFKDRTRIISDERRRVISGRNGLFLSTYLVDGFVAGTWRVQEERGQALLVLTPFESHDRETLSELENEGRALVAFLCGSISCEVLVQTM
jgi:hypothetical protein